MTLLVLDLRLPEADDVGNHEAATSTVTPGDLRRLR
jgi:hypothetical protein